MKTNYLRADQLASTLGLSKRTVERHVDSGLMVRPIRLGARVIAFPEQEVSVVLNARAVGNTDAEVRTLVQQLHAQRELQAAAARNMASLPLTAAPPPCGSASSQPPASSAGLQPGTRRRSSAERWRELVATPVKGGRNAPTR